MTTLVLPPLGPRLSIQYAVQQPWPGREQRGAQANERTRPDFGNGPAHALDHGCRHTLRRLDQERRRMIRNLGSRSVSAGTAIGLDEELRPGRDGMHTAHGNAMALQFRPQRRARHRL